MLQASAGGGGSAIRGGGDSPGIARVINAPIGGSGRYVQLGVNAIFFIIGRRRKNRGGCGLAVELAL